MTLFTTIVLACGKANFTNLSRYSNLDERTYRRQFEKAVDFVGLILSVIEAAIPAGREVVAAMDAVFVLKSGKATFGIDRFCNGTHSQTEMKSSAFSICTISSSG